MGAASLLQDEARRIAANVAKLPMLLVERSRHGTDEPVADVTLISNRTGTRPQRLLNH